MASGKPEGLEFGAAQAERPGSRTPAKPEACRAGTISMAAKGPQILAILTGRQLQHRPMILTGMSVTSPTAAANISQDLQVKTLKGKIQDWSTCPTTDPATKKQIVDKLQTQLDAVESADETAATKAQSVHDTGKGSRVDLTA